MLSEVKSAVDLWLAIRGIWHKRVTLVVISVILVCTAVIKYLTYIDYNSESFSEAFPATALTAVHFIKWTLAVIAVVVSWGYSNRLPKAKKNQIGILVSISTENDELKKRIRSDFIEALSMSESAMPAESPALKILEPSEYHINRLKTDFNRAVEYHQRCNCRLIFSGNCVPRKHMSKDHYYITSYVSISHQPIPTQLSRQIGSYIRSIYPKSQAIPIDDEIVGFQIFTHMFESTANYFIGLSYYLSGDYQTSAKLFEKSYQTAPVVNIDGKNKAMAPFNYRQHCKDLLVSSLTNNASIAYHNDDMRLMYANCMEALEIIPTSWQAHLNLGLYYFVVNRDVERAIQETAQAKNKIDGIYLYNLAFLFAYDGRLKRAYTIYRRAAEAACTPSTVSQTEEFVCRILREEPERIQLYYALGLIYFYGREDYVLAKEAFIKFIEQATTNRKFEEFVDFAEGMLRKSVAIIEEK